MASSEREEVYAASDAEELSAQLAEAEDILEQNRANCEGRSLSKARERLLDSALPAGLGGDLAAQACFLNAPRLDHAGYGPGGERHNLYMTYAPRFLKNGIDRGYWPTLLFAVQALSDPRHPLVPELDPLRVYRAVRLTYYRSTTAGAEMLADILRYFQGKYRFSPNHVEQADRWALRAYRSRFAAAPPIDPRKVRPCE